VAKVRVRRSQDVKRECSLEPELSWSRGLLRDPVSVTVPSSKLHSVS
jgi:hypothetical protein